VKVSTEASVDSAFSAAATNFVAKDKLANQNDKCMNTKKYLSN
jgi:hypothetical protein